MAEETEGAQKPAESVAVDLPQRGELKEAEQTEAEQEEKQTLGCEVDGVGRLLWITWPSSSRKPAIARLEFFLL